MEPSQEVIAQSEVQPLSYRGRGAIALPPETLYDTIQFHREGPTWVETRADKVVLVGEQGLLTGPHDRIGEVFRLSPVLVAVEDAGQWFLIDGDKPAFGPWKHIESPSVPGCQAVICSDFDRGSPVAEFGRSVIQFPDGTRFGPAFLNRRPFKSSAGVGILLQPDADKDEFMVFLFDPMDYSRPPKEHGPFSRVRDVVTDEQHGMLLTARTEDGKEYAVVFAGAETRKFGPHPYLSKPVCQHGHFVYRVYPFPQEEMANRFRVFVDDRPVGPMLRKLFTEPEVKERDVRFTALTDDYKIADFVIPL